MISPNPEALSDSAPRASRADNSTTIEKLQSLGLIQICWPGKCEADRVSKGQYDVLIGAGGMYALVFDNTFSKQLSKTATFVLLTYPTESPPLTNHHLHHSQLDGAGNISGSTLTGQRGPLGYVQSSGSNESVPTLGNRSRAKSDAGRPISQPESEDRVPETADIFTGILQKRRRRRHQGFARRFFSLDFASSTLSYYHDRQSSVLRGAIPLSLAAIGTNERYREISVDSGAEVWHLRAGNSKEFDAWKRALGRACASATTAIPTATTNARSRPEIKTGGLSATGVNPAEEREWEQVEALVGRVVGSRDAVRRLATQTIAHRFSSTYGLGISGSSNEASPTDSSTGEYFKDKDKKPFWKRKTSNTYSLSTATQRSASTQLAVATPISVQTGSPGLSPRPDVAPDEGSLHEHCMDLLKDLDSVLSEFSDLILMSKQRRAQGVATSHRLSIDSTVTQEFFDADDGEGASRLLVIGNSDDDAATADEAYLTDGELSSDDEQKGSFDAPSTRAAGVVFSTRPKSLKPLPVEQVPRRSTVPATAVPPPSLIGIFRKNYGKDLSTISMPVSANEPISLLQRLAEQLEYSHLLDSAAEFSHADNEERLIYVAAFAIASFSSNRHKERAVRKPFNPMLGETFELVSEKGFRFLAEKVSHHPMRMAFQGEATEWSISQAPCPTQKFYGKSAELIADGRVRVVFHRTGEHFSWMQTTSFLRNVIAGEKYVEPVGTMTIKNETTGQRAVATFKAGGMFAGRTEDVAVQVYDQHGNESSQQLVGKWTSSLSISSNGKEGKQIWHVGSLVDGASSRYGFTTFAATLNEITSIEKGKLPPTDSRLRPDQKAAEQGDFDSAEQIKVQLEDAQRKRRKQLEDEGIKFTPKWFTKVDGADDAWHLNTGKDGYWERRGKGDWSGVIDVFSVHE